MNLQCLFHPIGIPHERLVNITSRVMGLFLTAVAIEMMAKGLAGFLQANH